MAVIEGFRVTNYRCLKDLTFGRAVGGAKSDALTPISVVIGTNGSGKSSLFDAFGFLADALKEGVDNACEMRGRGGFERLVSAGSAGSIGFTLHYRETASGRLTVYSLEIGAKNGKVRVLKESLKRARTGKSRGKLYPFLDVAQGLGKAYVGEESSDDSGLEKSVPVALSRPSELAIASLSGLKDHPEIAKFRNFLSDWYLSYVSPNAVRGLPTAGAQRFLSSSGENAANVLQYLDRENKPRLKALLRHMTSFLPNIMDIQPERTADNRLILKFYERNFVDPFFAHQMSDGTLKLFVYLLLLNHPQPPSFICMEEPENGLYPELFGKLAAAFRNRLQSRETPQIFVTTHQPQLLDHFGSNEVWLLQKDPSTGFSQIKRANHFASIAELEKQEIPLGDLWLNGYLTGSA